MFTRVWQQTTLCDPAWDHGDGLLKICSIRNIFLISYPRLQQDIVAINKQQLKTTCISTQKLWYGSSGLSLS